MTMFPITDLSRADDIRMRRRRALWLLAGIVALPFLLFSGHDGHSGHGGHGQTSSEDAGEDLDVDLGRLSIHSDTMPATEIQGLLRRIPFVGQLGWMVVGAALPAGRRDATALSARGSSLTVKVRCAQSIVLVPQADLTDRVYVATSDGSPTGDSNLSVKGDAAPGNGGGLMLTGGCPSADLVVQVPNSMRISVIQEGATAFRLGAFNGPVSLTMRGSGDAVIDAASSLDVSRKGRGDVTVGRLNGALTLNQAGSGDTTISHIQSDKVRIEASGSGDISIGDGHIGHFDASVHGSGTLSAAAVIDTATVDASRNFSITLPHLKQHPDHAAPVDEPGQ